MVRFDGSKEGINYPIEGLSKDTKKRERVIHPRRLSVSSRKC